MVYAMPLQTVVTFLKMPVLAISLSHRFFFGGKQSPIDGENMATLG